MGLAIPLIVPEDNVALTVLFFPFREVSPSYASMRTNGHRLSSSISELNGDYPGEVFVDKRVDSSVIVNEHDAISGFTCAKVFECVVHF
jgi:hypothetical protein